MLFYHTMLFVLSMCRNKWRLTRWMERMFLSWSRNWRHILLWLTVKLQSRSRQDLAPSPHYHHWFSSLCPLRALEQRKIAIVFVMERDGDLSVTNRTAQRGCQGCSGLSACRARSRTRCRQKQLSHHQKHNNPFGHNLNIYYKWVLYTVNYYCKFNYKCVQDICVIHNSSTS